MVRRACPDSRGFVLHIRLCSLSPSRERVGVRGERVASARSLRIAASKERRTAEYTSSLHPLTPHPNPLPQGERGPEEARGTSARLSTPDVARLRSRARNS